MAVLFVLEEGKYIKAIDMHAELVLLPIRGQNVILGPFLCLYWLLSLCYYFSVSIQPTKMLDLDPVKAVIKTERVRIYKSSGLGFIFGMVALANHKKS